jgi:predicted nucleotidyltransferase
MDTRVNRIIRDYKRAVERLGIRIDKLILYGSHASGTAAEWSDIDVIVVSEGFAAMDIWERQVLLGRAAASVMEPIEAIGYTEEEYINAGSGTFIGDEVKGKGIEIA